MTDLRSQLQSTLGDTYTIERELGGGGMSRVFVAVEQSLGRQVVVKVLPTETAGHVSIERFRREIRLAASLQQANIVPVLSAGDAGGVAYYTMPFVKGESLRARLAMKGALPIAECIAILRDVARALAFAHDEGVVHRDIKPENILLSGGTAVVTDFGIAKAVVASSTQPGPATLTQMGMAIGTPAYMAPEQAVGESVDHRADLYALGVVAYEMLTGTAPFAGRSAQAQLAAHAMEAAPPLAQRRADVPPRLATLVARCLEKEPGDRPPSATAVIVEIETVVTPQDGSGKATPAAKPSIAVIPFANLSPDPADEYFADGLTDEIITDLSAVRALHVIARASMMRFKGSEKSPEAVAREVSVRYVLDGSVRRAGDSLRLTTRLLDTMDNSTIWSDKLGGTVADVFEMQEKVSRTIVDALRIALDPHEEEELRARPIDDLKAYEYYLQARQLMWTFTVPALDKARQLLEAAQARIGDNPRLIAALGSVHMNYLETGQRPASLDLAAAERCADELARLAPDSAGLHTIRGIIQWRRGEIREAIVSLSRARVLEPNNIDVGIYLSYAYILAGQDEKAREVAATTMALDPLTPLVQCMSGFCDIVAGRPENAVPAYRRFRDMDQDNPIAWLFFVWSLSAADERPEALRVADELARRFPNTSFGRIGGAYAHALRGDLEAGKTLLTSDLRALSQHSEAMATMLAGALALLGDVDGAIDTLENSVRLGLAHYPYLARDAKLYAPLRAHPRFRRLLEIVRERWERGGASTEDHARADKVPVPTHPKPSIAVLPLANLSASADDEYFADGMTEDIIAQLSKVASLRVISRTSVMRYKKTESDMRTIAGALGASHLVEGTVRRAGNRLRIVAQLIEASNDAHLWADTFDRELTDVFAIQSEVAERIATALRATLTPDERRRLSRAQTADPQAYDLCLRGRHHWNRRTDESIRRAISYFEQAISRDPGYAAAHAALAEAYVFAALGYAAIPRVEALTNAAAAAARALVIDPAVPEALCATGLTDLIRDWDVQRARGAFEQSINLNPGYSAAFQWLAWCLFTAGDYVGAARSQERALELDPLNVSLIAESGWPYSYAGLHELARQRYERALELDPAFGLGHYNLGLSYLGERRYAEAISALEKALSLLGRAPFAIWHLAVAHVETGRRDIAESLLAELKVQTNGGMAGDLFVALVSDTLGHTVDALDAIERAIENKEPMGWGLGLEEYFAFPHARANPRFDMLMRRAGIAPHDIGGQRALLLAHADGSRSRSHTSRP